MGDWRQSTDDELDAALQNVAVPEGLALRLAKVCVDSAVSSAAGPSAAGRGNAPATDKRTRRSDIASGSEQSGSEQVVEITVRKPVGPVIDARLRSVEIPDGLLDRLRAISTAEDPTTGTVVDDYVERDSALDAASELNSPSENVTSETDTYERVVYDVADDNNLTYEDTLDACLDEDLRDVPIPAGLVSQLEQIPRDVTEGDATEDSRRVMAGPQLSRQDNRLLDERLRDVRVPSRLLMRLRRIARLDLQARAKQRVAWEQLAVAAALVLAIGASYLGAMGSLLMSIRSGEPEVVLSVATEPAVTAEFVESQQFSVISRFDNRALDTDALPGVPQDSTYATTGATVPNSEKMDLDHVAPNQLEEIEFNLAGSSIAARLSDLWWLDPEREESFLAELNEFRWGPLAFPVDASADNLPELHLLIDTFPRGIAAPPGVREFVLEYGVHPPVLASRFPKSAVPLGAEAAGFERARKLVSEGRLPPRRQVRVEEFLAELELNLPKAAAGTLQLHVAAGPDPFAAPGSAAFGAGGTQLLQLAVQAGAVPHAGRQPAHVTLAIDISGSMRPRRLAMIRRALAGVFRAMSPDDRLSVVAFRDRAFVLAERASIGDAAHVLASFTQLDARGGTNVGAGLRLAFSVVGDTQLDEGRRRQVVLITDARGSLGGGTLGRIEHALSAAAREGVFLDVIDLGYLSSQNGWLAQLAAAGLAEVHAASTVDEIRWACLRSVTEQDQLVASAVELSLEFVPKAVGAYRLLGHEEVAFAESVGQDSAGSTTSNTVVLRSGESSTALYQMWLKPASASDVAVAQLRWRDAGGTLRQIRKRISLWHFAPSVRQSPRSLQLAAPIAQLAEILRGSRFATGTLEQIRLRLAEMDSPGAGWYVAPWLQFVEQARRARR